jgi:hypothetical protein
MIHKLVIYLLVSLAGTAVAGYGQTVDSLADRALTLPSNWMNRIQKKTALLDRQLTTQTENYLTKMARRDARLRDKLSQLDSGSSAGTNRSGSLLAGSPEKNYTALLQKLKSDTGSALAATRMIKDEYLPYADSLQGLLHFLQANPQALSGSKVMPTDVQNALTQVRQLQAKMQDADEVQQFLQQRQAQMKLLLSRYTQLPGGITSSYTEYNKQLYYYSAQIKSYKEALNDPDKAMKLAMTVLNKVPAFTNFMKNNSSLSGLFNLPGVSNPGATGQGLPQRDQVLAAFQNQAGTGGPDVSAVAQQQVQSAQGEVDQLRSRLAGLGNGGGADIDIPNFRPNDQKTKSFLHRLQYGVNIQTVHSSFFFPSTTDIGLSLGYKLDNNNVIGVGASYKLGWGKDIQHISMSSQGASLRSFVDIRLKKSFFATGGFEYNYQQPFTLADMPKLRSWQQSGLLGISKVISLKTKVFKQTKLQLLWDFLSYQQTPRAQPLKFRIGYNF